MRFIARLLMCGRNEFLVIFKRPLRSPRAVSCLVLAMLAGLMWPPFVKGQQEMLEKEYKEAIKAFQSKNFDIAERDFKSITQVEPEAPEPYFFLGKISLYRGQVAKAQAMLRHAIKLKPDFADALQSLGVVYLREKNYEVAESVLTRATRLSPQNAFAHLDLGTAYMEQRNFPGAIRQFQTALKLAHNDRGVTAAANYNLGQLFEALSHELARRKAYSQAVKDFEKYAAMFPQNPFVHHSLGVAYYNATRFELALSEFKTAIQLDPQAPQFYYAAAEASALLRRWDEARKYLSTLLTLNPKSFQANYLMGTILIDSLHYSQAIPYLREAIAIDPQKSEAYFKLGQAYLARKDANAAMAPLKKAIALDPSNSRAHWLLGRVYMDLNQPALASKEFQIFRNLQSKQINSASKSGAQAAVAR